MSPLLLDKYSRTVSENKPPLTLFLSHYTKETNVTTNSRANEKNTIFSSETHESEFKEIHIYMFYNKFPLFRIHLNNCLLIFIETI